MKITGLEPILISIPFEHGAPAPREGLGARGRFDVLFVRIDTDAGITGWGEAFGPSATPVTIAALERIIAPLVLGQDPRDVAELMRQLWRATMSISRSGPVAYALSGVDIALWDIKGKIEREPLWRLLGGKGRKHIAAYASLMRLDAEHVGKVAAAAVERGYRQIKLHARDVKAVAAARAAVGPDVPLMLDVNCFWPTVEEARAVARQMQPYDLAWLEEPLYPADDFAGLKELRRDGIVPIAAGENLGNVFDV